MSTDWHNFNIPEPQNPLFYPELLSNKWGQAAVFAGVTSASLAFPALIIPALAGATVLGVHAAKDAAVDKVNSIWEHVQGRSMPNYLQYLDNLRDDLRKRKVSDTGAKSFQQARIFIEALLMHPETDEHKGWLQSEADALAQLHFVLDEHRVEDIDTAVHELDQALHKRFNEYMPMWSHVVDFMSRSTGTNWLQPMTLQALETFAEFVSEQGKQRLQGEEQSALQDALQEFRDSIKEDTPGFNKYTNALQTLFKKRASTIFGIHVPFTGPTTKTERIKEKTIITPGDAERNEKIAKTKADSLRTSALKKAPYFLCHYFLMHYICNNEKSNTTLMIKNHMTDFEVELQKQFDETKSAWRRLLAKFLWNWTPLFWATNRLITNIVERAETWVSEQVEVKKARTHDIKEAQILESILKQWVGANLNIQDLKSYTEEISDILMGKKGRKEKINQLTRKVINICYPDITFVGWHRSADQKLAEMPNKCHWVIRPVAWVVSMLIRGAAFVLKTALQPVQSIVNAVVKFILQEVTIYSRIVHKLFDFRQGTYQGEHQDFEYKIKTLVLNLLTEVNNTDYSTRHESVSDGEFQQKNHHVEQTLYALLRVLDLHDTHDWTKEGIKTALEINPVSKLIRQHALPLAVDQGLVIFNDLYHTILRQKMQTLRFHIFNAFDSSMTNTSTNTQITELDVNIASQVREFRQDVIRQLLLRMMESLGEKDFKESAAYTAKLAEQSKKQKDWFNRLQHLWDNPKLEDIELLIEDVEKAEAETTQIFNCYQPKLPDYFAPKVYELYQKFRHPHLRLLKCLRKMRLDVIAMETQLDRGIEKLATLWEVSKKKLNTPEVKEHIAFSYALPAEDFYSDADRIQTFTYYDDLQREILHRYLPELWDYDLQWGELIVRSGLKKLGYRTEAAQKDLTRENIPDIIRSYTPPDKQVQVSNLSLPAIRLKIQSYFQSLLEISMQLNKCLEEKKLIDTILDESFEDGGKSVNVLDNIRVKGRKAQHSFNFIRLKLTEYGERFDTDLGTVMRLMDSNQDTLQETALGRNCTNMELIVDEIRQTLNTRRSALHDSIASFKLSYYLEEAMIDRCLVDAKAWCFEKAKPDRESACNQLNEALDIADDLAKNTSEASLKIPFFKFVFNSDIEDDKDGPVFKAIQFLTGQVVEYHINRLLELPKHPVFMPWFIRQALLECV